MRGRSVTRFTSSQSGMALALVLSDVDSIVSAGRGLAAISREGTGSIDAKVISAKAFYLGKGAARLVMRDRARDRSGDLNSDGSDDALRPERIYTAEYEFDGASVTGVFTQALVLCSCRPNLLNLGSPSSAG